MLRRILLSLTALALIALGIAAFSFPAAPDGDRPPPEAIAADEQAALIASMRPPKRARPLIAVLAQNAGTETTDFLVPWAVLTESGAADVLAVAAEARPIRLTPALTVDPQLTLSAFDALHPDGADYVVVPKIQDAADPTLVSWIRAQAAHGATIVGICSGVKTLSAAGMLEGRRATGHWFDLDGLRKDNPTMQWVPDRRYVADRGVVTTTGVSASLPVSLALVEAFAGGERAATVAEQLGAGPYSAEHDSAAFRLDRRSLRAALLNRYATGTADLRAIPVAEGIDEVGLAFTADAWARTFRTAALTVGNAPGPIVMRRGLVLRPDLVASALPPETTYAPAISSFGPAKALPSALESISGHYGAATAEFVALQLELSWRAEP